MRMHRRNHKEPLPWVDLAMLAVVASFFAYSSVALWKNPDSLKSAQAPVAAPAARELAAASAPAAAAEEKSTKIFEMGCVGELLAKLETEAALLQVKGRSCAGGKVLGQNQTTKEGLQVFLQGQKFTTHYFPLLPGANRILLEEGKKQSVLEVLRKSK